jgi:hypothetical protein
MGFGFRTIIKTTIPQKERTQREKIKHVFQGTHES